MKFSGDKVFEGIPAGKEEACLFARFLDEPSLAGKIYAIYAGLPTGGAGLQRAWIPGP